MIVSDRPVDSACPQTIRGDVAIVGMACTFPRARNLHEFWRNIVTGLDATDDVPPQRWDPNVFYDKFAGKDGKVYCKRGGFLAPSFVFNPLKFKTMPRALDGGEPDQFLVLRTAYEAVADAGLSVDDLPGERTGLVIGRGNYLGAGQMGVIQRGLILEQTVQSLRALRPDLSDQDLEAIRADLVAQLPGWGPDAAPGVIPNISAGRVANRLNLMGPTFTIDAACASSLVATEVAVRGLLSGQFDLALAGGVHIFSDVPFLQVFCALGALSASETIRPYDRSADGTLAGEGVGLVVLKRLEDAEISSDRIYAVIRGVGTSSDGRALSVTAPRAEGGELALRRAYEMAGIDPATVTLIEGHGTGTTAGDENELTVLGRVLGPRRGSLPRVALGSVKSMIGHAMPAAGVASLIKTALSVYHGVLPPTLNCHTPHELLGGTENLLYANTRLRPWLTGRSSDPRRAGINAFGFGGVNAHVVLEEYAPKRRPVAPLRTAPTTRRPAPLAPLEWESEILVVSASARAALVDEAQRLRDYLARTKGIALRDVAYTYNAHLPADPASHRLAIVATSVDDLAAKLALAIKRLADPDCKQIKDGKGVYYLTESPLRGGKVAFVFPGLGSQYPHQLSDLCMAFTEVREVFQRADQSVELRCGASLSELLFPPPTISDDEATDALSTIDAANPAVATANGAMFRLLETLGLRADMMTGHSSGEWVVMPASGMVPADEFIDSMRRLNDLWSMLRLGDAVAPMVMLNVAAGRETIAAIAAELGVEMTVANDNCPHQVVVAVAPCDADHVREAIKKRMIFVERLPLEHGYHTEEFTYVTDALRDYFAALPLSRPSAKLYSATTTEPYPDKPEEVVALLAHTFASPLRFRDTIERMYDDGARIFVEVGPRANLTAFIDDILRGRPHAAVATNQHRRTGITSLNHALAQLAALHVPMALDPLYERRGAVKLTLDPATDVPVDEASEPGAVQVSICVPRMVAKARPLPPAEVQPAPMPSHEQSASIGHLEVPSTSPLPSAATPLSAGQANDGIFAAALQNHFRLMEAFLDTNREVLSAFLSAPPAESQGQRLEFAHKNVPAPAPALPALQQPPTPPAAEAETEDLPPPPSAAVEPAIHSPTFTAQKPESLEMALLQIVSERTGYPPDMLDLDLDMEADLGIDSIKRVEILGGLQQRVASSHLGGEIDLEEVARKKTLREVLSFLEATAAGDPAPRRKEDGAPAPGHRPPASMPLLLQGEIVEHLPSERAVVVRDVNVDNDLYLADHCFDPFVSDADPDRERLCVVPLTVSVEMMAEVASLLAPEERIVAARDLQAARWIEVEDGAAPVRLRIEAIKTPGDSEAKVTIRRQDAPESDAPLVEGTYRFAREFPVAEAPKATLGDLQPSRYTAAQMYNERHMFHGPRFHGVRSIDGVCDSGLRATLEVLPLDNLLRGNRAPRFVFDPVLLDAAGQLVGYWPLEHLTEGFVLFPIRIREIQLFHENLQPGEKVSCEMVIEDLSARKLSASMTIADSHGSVWMRILGWQDWRFYWEPIFNNFRRFPNRHFVSESVPLPDRCAAIECRRVALFGDTQSPIWENLWAHLILGRDELAEYRSRKPGRHRATWMLGRAAAKDAVRAWIKRNHDLDLYPADVRICVDDGGQPAPSGDWVERVGRAPGLSISHKDGVAVAVAGPGCVGVDLETITERSEGFEDLGFSKDEREILTGVNGGSDRLEWLTRAWCAKEAVGKAMGVGLEGNPRSFAIESVNVDAQQLVVRFGQSGNKTASAVSRSLLVQSFRDGEYVVALTQHEGK